MKEHPSDKNSKPQSGSAFPGSQKQSLEITGLGVIASLILVALPLVGDGTLNLSDYLVYATFLLVAASALAWRLVSLAPVRMTRRR